MTTQVHVVTPLAATNLRTAKGYVFSWAPVTDEQARTLSCSLMPPPATLSVEHALVVRGTYGWLLGTVVPCEEKVDAPARALGEVLHEAVWHAEDEGLITADEAKSARAWINGTK